MIDRPKRDTSAPVDRACTPPPRRATHPRTHAWEPRILEDAARHAPPRGTCLRAWQRDAPPPWRLRVQQRVSRGRILHQRGATQPCMPAARRHRAGGGVLLLQPGASWRSDIG